MIRNWISKQYFKLKRLIDFYIIIVIKRYSMIFDFKILIDFIKNDNHKTALDYIANRRNRCILFLNS